MHIIATMMQTMPVSAAIQVFNVRDLSAAPELLELMPVALAAGILTACSRIAGRKFSGG